MSGILRQLRRWFSGKPQPSARTIPRDEPEEDEIPVRELTVAQLQAELDGEQPPLLLDVREPYEWRQVHMPNALHIPMHDIPARLGELSENRPIVVFCAHGSRSYSVAAYLMEQGYRASSLSGGITEWMRAGGEVVR
jgi:rhodanese-related sulfurtransferase